MTPSRHWPPAVLLALLSAACQPDSPTTQNTSGQNTTAPAPASSPQTAPAAASSSAAGPVTDTLRLPTGRELLLRASSAAAFERLAATDILPPEGSSADPDRDLTATRGRVRRQGLDLLLQPDQGSVVKLHTTPPAKFTIQNPDAVRYVYWGSLPQAHQWVVQAWFWESAAVILVDQRTGRQLEVPGRPAASPDGRYVLSTSPGLGGGDQVNSLSLVRISDAGPQLLWQHEPATWAPEQARWDGPGRAVLQISRADAEGQLPDPPRPEYVELTVPTAP